MLEPCSITEQSKVSVGTVASRQTRCWKLRSQTENLYLCLCWFRMYHDSYETWQLPMRIVKRVSASGCMNQSEKIRLDHKRSPRSRMFWISCKARCITREVNFNRREVDRALQKRDIYWIFSCYIQKMYWVTRHPSIIVQHWINLVNAYPTAKFIGL